MYRETNFTKLLKEIKSYRINQIYKNLFNPKITSFNEMSDISLEYRELLTQEMPFSLLTPIKVLNSKNFDTFKAILKTTDNMLIETVLMQNNKGHFTICLSSQVGCAMDCSFCATGKMGLKKSLNADEIIDQVRFWQAYLYNLQSKNEALKGSKITNIVYMGMGEPLANYENVKYSLNKILQFTEIGKSKITVSTVGVIPSLKKILTDKTWPHVKIAISLHSADQTVRKSIVPTTFANFFNELQDWTMKYISKFGNKSHHLTFEYVMLHNINDRKEDAVKLANFAKKFNNVKVNIIPYNFIGAEYKSSSEKNMRTFKNIVRESNVNITQRKNMGTDIDAACGQLITKENKSKLNN